MPSFLMVVLLCYCTMDCWTCTVLYFSLLASRFSLLLSQLLLLDKLGINQFLSHNTYSSNEGSHAFLSHIRPCPSMPLLLLLTNPLLPLLPL
ncbi:hypothetical protein B0H65DRAFT_191219 [Neurospora tetraspora]|uniref:Uncharacterized protein n=1 Tax=Neurospora tetraspora TaxID=94610 RepID=A0AAE0JEQ1_9PEZI|nr:hypothetical protein B0H65DRAFT_191219 [Neurospora tetraspora]